MEQVIQDQPAEESLLEGASEEGLQTEELEQPNEEAEEEATGAEEEGEVGPAAKGAKGEPVTLDPSATYKIGDLELTGEEIKRGYLRQADYTKKTQALAEERKALAEKTKQVETELAHYVNSTSLLGAAVAQLITNVEQEYREMGDDDPEKRRRYNEVKTGLEHIGRALQAEAQQTSIRLIQQAEEKLPEALAQLIPDAIDPEAVEGIRSKARKFLASMPNPYTKEEIDILVRTDPRIVFLAYEAAMRKEEKKKLEEAKTKSPPPKQIKNQLSGKRQPGEPQLGRYIDGSPLLDFPSLRGQR